MASSRRAMIPERMDSDRMGGILRSGTGLQIENGGIDIPGTEIATKGSPCDMEVWLDAIHYSQSGDDIGSEWRFDAVVRGVHWTSGRVTLSRGNTLQVGRRIALWQ